MRRNNYLPAKSKYCPAGMGLVLCLFLFLPFPAGANQPDSSSLEYMEEGAPPTDYSFDFKVTPKLKEQVEFWKNIYSKYSSYQSVIHDKKYLSVVYTVLDFSHLKNKRMSYRSRRRKRVYLVKKAKEKYRRILKKLAGRRIKLEQLNAEEKRVYGLFAHIDEKNKFYKATGWRRIRSQRGQKDKFQEAITRSGLYMAEMEEIFRKAGLPVELTRLPFVESFFNPYARSKCGATGMWQFMYSTGRLYMTINHLVDERRDPFVATAAAARLLTDNYEKLGSWPLALTAYNHGALGVARGLRRTQAETLEELIESYKHRRFGFASKNFYAEFLAALDVYENYKTYFGELELEKPLRYSAVELPHYSNVNDLARYCSIDKKTIASLNPGLRRAVMRGYNLIPKGFMLRIPSGAEERFLAAYESMPQEKKYLAQKGVLRHKVRRGETLSLIARRYGSSVDAILAVNNLRSRHFVRAGAYLKIPTSSTISLAAASSGGGRRVRHRVRRGETLSQIARRYRTSIEGILAANSLRNRHFLQVGQYLHIPGAGAPVVVADKPLKHRVRRGETLTTIARRYGTTVRRVARANRLDNKNLLLVGQVLTVPAKGQLLAYDAGHDKEAAEEERPEGATPQEQIVESEALEKEGERTTQAASASQAAEEESSPIGEITVYPHETLGHYAEWANVSTNSLRRLNGLSYRQNIHAGRRLLVDFSQVSREEFEKKRQSFNQVKEQEYLSRHKIEKVLTHTLKARQNVWYLCRYVYKVPFWLVKKYNADKDLATMREGDEVLIPVLKKM